MKRNVKLQKKSKRGKRGGKVGRPKKVVVKRTRAPSDDAFYAKYKHVVPGSLRTVKVGAEVDGLWVVHPRICTITCKETGVARVIHAQDAHQVFFCKEVQAQRVKERAAKARRNK